MDELLRSFNELASLLREQLSELRRIAQIQEQILTELRASRAAALAPFSLNPPRSERAAPGPFDSDEFHQRQKELDDRYEKVKNEEREFRQQLLSQLQYQSRLLASVIEKGQGDA